MNLDGGSRPHDSCARGDALQAQRSAPAASPAMQGSCTPVCTVGNALTSASNREPS